MRGIEELDAQARRAGARDPWRPARLLVRASSAFCSGRRRVTPPRSPPSRSPPRARSKRSAAIERKERQNRRQSPPTAVSIEPSVSASPSRLAFAHAPILRPQPVEELPDRHLPITHEEGMAMARAPARPKLIEERLAQRTFSLRRRTSARQRAESRRALPTTRRARTNGWSSLQNHVSRFTPSTFGEHPAARRDPGHRIRARCIAPTRRCTRLPLDGSGVPIAVRAAEAPSARPGTPPDADKNRST